MSKRVHIRRRRDSDDEDDKESSNEDSSGQNSNDGSDRGYETTFSLSLFTYLVFVEV